ncbi:reverse transcriptase domain-containing protein [Sessilibacter corallicola]|uniref:reverse transcriptase domain-containing protein n=1 Tax=Sessilibacter corallicola TaxID=2904075 RepID=UPI001E4D3A55|nr:reverse transcriptase domain-containing protein [Sessilibacter corallicola]MCE2030154.1 reverse transcriptase family protein [Sessilibacter corallicola]
MALTINKDIIVWGLSVIQPASISELRGFLCAVTQDENVVPDGDYLAVTVKELILIHNVLKVATKPARYSVTHKGGIRLTKKLRYLRDRMRLFLLKDSAYGRFHLSSDVLDQNLDDASSSSSIGLKYQDAQRSNSFLAADQKAIWPLVSEQFQIGSTSASDDKNTPTYADLDCYSFDSAYFEGSLKNTSDLSEAIGVSIRLITSICKKKEKHYRSFEIPKKRGGTRPIDSPRTFLKVIQKWINDYFIYDLKQSNYCYSYKKGVSIKSHAQCHEKQNYVACVDIEDFYGSLTKDHIYNLLLKNNKAHSIAKVVSDLCTFNNKLPQGAPTSPILSNAFLYDLDNYLVSECEGLNVTYSRFADDITISSDSKENLIRLISMIKNCLRSLGLSLKDSKTRILHKSQKQLVTGLVVNEIAKPARTYRRRIRAIFHKAKLYPDSFKGKEKVLQGYLSYLSSYNCLSSDTQSDYKQTILNIKNLTSSSNRDKNS